MSLSIDKNLSEIIKNLMCPITKEFLVEADINEIDNMNEQIENKNLFFCNNEIVEKKITAALINNSKTYAYLVEDNIPILLSMHAISLNKNNSLKFNLTDERFLLKNFYDEIGWKSDENGLTCYNDAKLFEDLRDVSKKYISHANSRISRLFDYSGKYFLDVASGPLQYDDYINFSRNFQIRVCVDISIVALKAARKRLNGKGIYILADITNLPFQNNTFCGSASLHTIYHVPANLQKTAFEELERVLKSNSKCAIVYSWGNQSILMKFFMAPFRLVSFCKYFIEKLLFHKDKTALLYFSPYNASWIRNLKLEKSNVDILVWRSLSVPFLKVFIHKLFLGGVILKLFSKLEDNYPFVLGKIGQYPLIVIKKGSKIS